MSAIIAERSQSSTHLTPWWWLRGETYPHRDLLKRWGCRWSKRRQAWYFIGERLPEAVQALIDTQPEDDAPCSDEEAAAIPGVDIQPKPQPGKPRLYALDETVYARHDLVSPDGKLIPTGTRVIVTRLYNRNASHGWSYDVDFADICTGWYFERELTDLEPILGIRITHGAVVPPGAALPSTDADLKRALVESGHLPEPLAQESAPVEPETALEPDTPEEPQAIRVFKPQPLPVDGTPLDEVQTAIVRAKTKPTPVLHQTAVSQKHALALIGQSCVGELTGSITGNVWCYGYAIHEGICVFVNMGGPRMAVEAIRAKLAKGDIVSCVPWDAPSVELTAGEGNTGMYTAFTQNIPEAKFTSMILLHERVTQPNYGGKSTTFILRISDEQAMAQLRHHVTKLVKVPVFPEWTSYLWQAGQSAMLVRKTRGAGGLDVMAVDLDVDAWTRLITGGIEQGVIVLPSTS
ncbi:MAG: hypothetical protein OHK0023_13900 [Anaerolineae bacterium]